MMTAALARLRECFTRHSLPAAIILHYHMPVATRQLNQDRSTFAQ
jgi:hypothetical protein